MKLQTLGRLHLEVEGKDVCRRNRDRFILSYMAIEGKASYSTRHFSEIMFVETEEGNLRNLENENEIYRAHKC